MPKVLDLLLVTPPSRPQVYQNLSQEYAAIEPPVWSTLIATFASLRGYSVSILDGEADELSIEHTAREIVMRKARLTVFVVYGQQPSASTQCMPASRAVAKLVKEEAPQLHTIIMGTHASALPERTLREEPYEFVVEGEGPYTIISLLEALKREEYEKVPGLWYKKENRFLSNKPAQKIANLDQELPGQAWDLLDIKKYRAHNWHCFDHIDSRKPYASLQTSLGCPYKCSFCCINAPFGGAGIRYWSPATVLKQIDYLVKKHSVKNIKFPDEMFVLNEKHVLGICDGIIERGYDLNIWAYARIDTVKQKFLEKLKKAGFRWLAIGIESGSKHVRDGVEKGRFGEKDIVTVVKTIQEAGIYVGANYIFGLPDDTTRSMQATLDLSKFLNTEWANFYGAMAYPGSPLYTIAIKQKWPLPADWIGYSQHSFETLPLPTETLTGSEVLQFRDKAFLDYFSNPAYLTLLKNQFGQRVVDHVRQMTSIPVSRKHVPLAKSA